MTVFVVTEGRVELHAVLVDQLLVVLTAVLALPLLLGAGMQGVGRLLVVRAPVRVLSGWRSRECQIYKSLHRML